MYHFCPVGGTNRIRSSWKPPLDHFFGAVLDLAVDRRLYIAKTVWYKIYN